MEDGEARRLERSDLFRVLLWRVDALLEAGFSPGQARDLGADLGVDVDLAVSMVRSGTAADVAALQLLEEAASRCGRSR